LREKLRLYTVLRKTFHANLSVELQITKEIEMKEDRKNKKEKIKMEKK